MDLREIEGGGMDWIHLAQDGDQWPALATWTYGFHKILVNSWIAERLMASQEGLSSIELIGELIPCIRYENNVIKSVKNNLTAFTNNFHR
jgi:hypothetical protein